MTLSMAALTPEGIVLSADSRQTYMNLASATRIGTDNANKLFKLSKKIGVVIAGRAFALDDKGQLKSLGWFIEQFQKEVIKKTNPPSIKIVAENLIKYFQDKKLDNISFIVAGYGEDETGKAYLCNVPGEVIEGLSRDTSYGGFLRIGQQDVVSRIMNGWAPELFEIDFIKKAQDDGVDIGVEMNKAQYNVNWGTITMQDAVDFCLLMTQITESIQRFSDGTILHPGGIPGVGGPVDIATITLADGFCWLRKKELKVEYK